QLDIRLHAGLLEDLRRARRLERGILEVDALQVELRLRRGRRLAVRLAAAVGLFCHGDETPSESGKGDQLSHAGPDGARRDARSVVCGPRCAIQARAEPLTSGNCASFHMRKPPSSQWTFSKPAFTSRFAAPADVWPEPQ